MFVTYLSLCRWLGIGYAGLRKRLDRGQFPKAVRKGTWWLADVKAW